MEVMVEMELLGPMAKILEAEVEEGMVVMVEMVEMALVGLVEAEVADMVLVPMVLKDGKIKAEAVADIILQQ